MTSQSMPRVTDALHTLVHDMRSPLQAILSSTDVLAAAPLDQGVRAVVERVHRSAHALDAHMADLATLMLIQSKALKSRPISFEVGELLEEAKEVCSRRGLRVSVAASAEPIFAIGDAVLIRGMLGRLLGAFSKLAKDRAVTVAVDSVDRAASVLSFRVRSPGAGQWPQGFIDRLLPASAVACAIGGDLETFDGDSAVLRVPVSIEDGKGREGPHA